MTDEQILHLLKQYKEYLEMDALREKTMIMRKEALDHLLSMIPKMEAFIKEGRRDKTFRWLGFMQGVLWSFGEFRLNELRDHNR